MPAPVIATVAVLFCCAVVGGAQAPVPSVAPGLPFTADVIDEVSQVLADGTRIHEVRRGKLYRDSQGRTRNEVEYRAPNGDGPIRQTVSISDPVQQVSIHLNVAQKVAMVGHRKIPGPPQLVMTTPALHTPPHVTAVPNATINVEQLGEKQIEGFTVTGTRRTRTIPPEGVGNDKPLVAVEESWLSQQLGQVLLHRRDDPRDGEIVHKLVNIVVGEPDPSVFQIPADYEVKEQSQ